jgi:peptidoglycan hydrolase-like protein with peptidoglycan-binding domain
MSWRVAKSLLKLREQVNSRAPDRDKGNDGTIGDAAHASRSSDHNPWVTDQGVGVVTAIDITDDPKHKVVAADIAEVLRKSKDPRIKYVISRGKIFSSETRPWQWRPYNGPNPHDKHVHLSVKSPKVLFDNTKEWPLPPALGGQDVVPLSLADSVSLGDMAHVGERGERAKKIQEALKKAGATIVVDGDYGPLTEAKVKVFQQLRNLQVDGIVGPATAAELDKYLSATPPPPIPEPEIKAPEWQSGKGSWYSQYEGVYHWVDSGDAPGSAALGVPDSAQGVSFYDWSTLGKWFEIEYPNGHKSIEQQTDIGPSPWTGKKIDISAAAAERAGYSPKNFPTGAVIKWRKTDPPAGVYGIGPKEAAVKYRDIRKTAIV